MGVRWMKKCVGSSGETLTKAINVGAAAAAAAWRGGGNPTEPESVKTLLQLHLTSCPPAVD